MIESYRDLVVWQRAIQMALAIYRVTTDFPKEEAFGLSVQMRRAGVSVATHIAEGHSRGTSAEYRHHLGISRGSNAEIQTQLVLAGNLAYASPADIRELEDLSSEVAKMLNSLIPKIPNP
jgi:four helix bundle protein